MMKVEVPFCSSCGCSLLNDMQEDGSAECGNCGTTSAPLIGTFTHCIERSCAQLVANAFGVSVKVTEQADELIHSYWLEAE